MPSGKKTTTFQEIGQWFLKTPLFVNNDDT